MKEDSSQLLRTAATEYGEKYQEHLLEQYKLFVELMDKVSERRQNANNYFLTINAFLVSLFGVLANFTSTGTLGSKIWSFLVPVAGLLVCITWVAIIKSFRQLNAGKFQIIHELETALPAALFDAEWKVLGEGTGAQYTPTTRVEVLVPRIFAGLYLVLVVYGIVALFLL